MILEQFKSIIKTLLTVLYIGGLSLYSAVRGLYLRVFSLSEPGGVYRGKITELRNNGCVVFESYYSSEEVEEMKVIAENHMQDEYGDYDHVNQMSYFRRPLDGQESDGGVFRMFGFNEIDLRPASFFTDPVLKEIIEKAFHTKIVSHAALLQKNQPVGSETRGFHVDMYAPKQFKAFLFLTDVVDERHGPLAIIKQSHKWHLRRYANFIRRGLRNLTDVSSFDDLNDRELSAAQLFTVKKGTVVIASQQAVHRGWPLQVGPRYVMVNYFVEKLSQSTPGYRINRRIGYRYST
jgi:hypothetical protein